MCPPYSASLGRVHSQAHHFSRFRDMARINSILLFFPLALSGQSVTPAAKAVPMLTEVQQIASAVLPLPKEFRGDARVLGYRTASAKLSELRAGKGDFTCLASNPSAPQFHVACYHKSMEPFMARGRELRDQGVKGDQVDSVRFKEVRSGKLRMPAHPAALYQLTGPAGSYDPASNTVAAEVRSLFVIYIPGATSASTGLSAQPVEGGPWIMFPGTPKAHIMLVPKM
jgi:hypothetical protein